MYIYSQNKEQPMAKVKKEKVRKLIDLPTGTIDKLTEKAKQGGFARGGVDNVKSYSEAVLEKHANSSQVIKKPKVKHNEGSESEDFEEG